MPFKSEKQRKWMHSNEPKMAKKWEKEEKPKKESKVKSLIKKMVREIMDERKLAEQISSFHTIQRNLIDFGLVIW
jgi:ribosomal protein S25